MTAKEQFNKILLRFDAPMLVDDPEVLEAMQTALDLGKSESEATIENLASRVVNLEAENKSLSDQLNWYKKEYN